MVARDHFRAWSRRRVELGAMLRDRQTAEEEQVRVRDLGLGGACVELGEVEGSEDALSWPGVPGLATLLEPEAAVTLELTAPTLWDPLPLRGKVAWLQRGAGGRAPRAGVRFEHHDSATLFALYKVLVALGPETH
jgi:hypothetical protein